MYDPNDRIELPYTVVRRLLNVTAQDVGCPDYEADTIAQSAWHLVNRGLDGVDYTLRYLAILKQFANVERLAIAPLAIDMGIKLNQGERRSSAFLSPPAPLLLLPAASFGLNESGAETDGILFTFNDQTVVYSKAHGKRIESLDAQGLMVIDPFDAPTCTASRVDFLAGERQGIEFEFNKNLILHLPQCVYRGEETVLDLAPLFT